MSEALRVRDYIYSIYQKKYHSISIKYHDNKIKYYVLGENPDKEGYGLVDIDLYRGKNKKGENRIFVTVSYGPINYIDTQEDI